jgi:pimeloyl-ACP methyl ester carboxylesterase
MSNIQPFHVAVSQEVLDDLRERLGRTRWPDEVAELGWAYGMPLAYLQDLVSYWHDSFDWRKQEQSINSFEHFRAVVQGVGIHFIHERGRGPDPLPLIITHGWPSSVVEMLKIIPLLTDPARHGGDPADSFDVVVPSIPGYGFSDRAMHPGMITRRIAALWVHLMLELGYPRFGAHTHDIGASINTHIAFDHPERLIGYHTSEPSIPRPYLGPDAPEFTEAEREYRAYQQSWHADEGGYAAVQATRPQTLAYGLNDSPAGLAAWIVEKWYAWTAPAGGDLEQHFSKDEVLTNVMVYWATQTINSANRIYYISDPNPREIGLHTRITVPVGVVLGATQPIERAPREYAARLFADIRQWVELGRGGHFLVGEEPQLVAGALRDFFRPLREGR